MRPLTEEEIADRKRKLHRDEWMSDSPVQTYYVSIANDEQYYGGFIGKARGGLDIVAQLHVMGLYPHGSGCSTVSHVIDDDAAENIPEDWYYRIITAGEASQLMKWLEES